MGNPVDETDKLEAFNIYVNSMATLPVDLREYIQKEIEAPRKVWSPAATNLYRNQPSARNANERSGIDILADDLLFRDEVHGGEDHICRVAEAYLRTAHLPTAPSALVEKQHGKVLTQPIADTAIGYISSKDSKDRAVAPLTRKEELVITPDALVSMIHFPFLTCQWKSATGTGGTMSHAQNQSARDGTAIVNYLHDFYTRAAHEPSAVDTCHWSVTCDMHSAMLWVHWRNFNKEEQIVEHHMTLVDQQFLRSAKDVNNKAMEGFRSQLRNILNWALGQRLHNLKAAIPQYEVNEAKKLKRAIPAAARKASQQTSNQGRGSNSRALSEESSPQSSKRPKIGSTNQQQLD
ncbi:hypothetical protein P153DRAFT_303612 [Dothidotthia symphoricarpi CBS 119687]|uniref:DUF7924 domain-containing protein n=1 Tax=Dothidotthia symphoricarpi CBS 119687 TaxID=1392245 RepID=A0A6A5ZV29_9PLEO|nr:uncharacterized protein P153DRAFT_303612 [Dothidotthia symphoricarpi CBS 119687]KAF2123572.1 hypothetical protein P153DRAFT_303612 [Dothidotthia symphoricarpi CBS 119687]